MVTASEVEWQDGLDAAGRVWSRGELDGYQIVVRGSGERWHVHVWPPEGQGAGRPTLWPTFEGGRTLEQSRRVAVGAVRRDQRELARWS